MTRTAADVQAEIDALKLASHERHLAAMAEVRAIPEEQQFVAGLLLDAHSDQLDQESAALDGLKVERDRLARAELDAATPPEVRAGASLMRAAFYAAGGTVVDGADHAWETLSTEQAQAWAAVAREAGRG